MMAYSENWDTRAMAKIGDLRGSGHVLTGNGTEKERRQSVEIGALCDFPALSRPSRTQD